ncbi:MAG: hypothetical protein R3B98_00730 [Hyphomonas sp.]
MRKVLILAAFAVFALLSLLILPVLIEALTYGDLKPAEAARTAAIMGPTVVLGWFAWLEVRPLPKATQERLVPILNKMVPPLPEGKAVGIPDWHREPTLALVRMRSPLAVRAFLRRNPMDGFRALQRDAEDAEAKKIRSAPERWRDLGVLAAGIDNDLAALALGRARAAGCNDFMVNIMDGYLAWYVSDWKAVRAHAEAALKVAGSEALEFEALTALDLACTSQGDWRGAAEVAKRSGLTIRRGGDVPPQVMQDYADSSERIARQILKLDGAEAAKSVFNESLAIRIAIAKQLGTPEAQRDVIAAYDRAADILSGAAGKPYRDWARQLEAKLEGGNMP